MIPKRYLSDDELKVKSIKLPSQNMFLAAAMKRSKPVEWNGIRYDSLGQMALKHRVSRHKITTHLKNKTPFNGHLITRVQK